jgi:hypothetical protein
LGLNLQPGRLVVNLDVPWNPAVLEQRISRTHRLGQRDAVNVINLVARDTIEERVLEALEAKREVFEGVFGLEGEAPDRIDFRGKGTLVRTLKAVLEGEEKAPPVPAAEVPVEQAAKPAGPRPGDEEPYYALADLVLPGHRGKILLVSGSPFAFGKGKVLVVTDGDVAEVRKTVEEAASEVASRFGLPEPPACAVFDREGYRSLLLLAGNPEPGTGDPLEAWRAPSFTEGMPHPSAPGPVQRRVALEARRLLDHGRDRHAFARLASGGGYAADAIAPLRETVESALKALFLLEGADPDGVEDIEQIEKVLVRPGVLRESAAHALVPGFLPGEEGTSPSPAAVEGALQAADALLSIADEKAVALLA